jgi:uncharacterized protein (DUF58 family)
VMKGLASFLIILLVIAAILQLDVYFSVLYLLGAVYLLSRLWNRRMLDPVSAKRSFVERAFHGERIDVALDVHNRGRLPIPYLEIHEGWPVQLSSPPFYRRVISLGPRERRRFEYTLVGRRRGYYEIGPFIMRGGGLFGIHPAQSIQVGPAPLIVYPQVVPLQQLGLPTRSPLVKLPARSPLFEDPSCVIGVRDYQWGDSPRRIHWTATANVGHLLVKQYRPSIARETLICLDLSRRGYSQETRFVAPELAIVVAASIANHITTYDGLAVGLATEATDPLVNEPNHFFLTPRSGRGHLMSLLEILARVQLCDASSFSTLLRHESVRLSWGGTMVVITGRESESLYEGLVHLRRTGFAVALILVQPRRPSPELQARANLLGVPVYRVWREADLREGIGEPMADVWR